MTSTFSPFFVVLYHTGVVDGGVDVMKDVSTSIVGVNVVGVGFFDNGLDVDIFDGLVEEGVIAADVIGGFEVA